MKPICQTKTETEVKPPQPKALNPGQTLTQILTLTLVQTLALTLSPNPTAKTNPYPIQSSPKLKPNLNINPCLNSYPYLNPILIWNSTLNLDLNPTLILTWIQNQTETPIPNIYNNSLFYHNHYPNLIPNPILNPIPKPNLNSILNFNPTLPLPQHLSQPHTLP